MPEKEIFISDLREAEEFTAGDGCTLRELLHPGKQPLALGYSLAHAAVEPGQTTAPHRLKESSEVYFILEGEGLMHIDDEVAPVRPGQAVYIPPGARQFISNLGDTDLVFICLVDPGWRVEDEEVFASG